MKYLKRITSLFLFSTIIINSAFAEVKNANNQEIIALMKNGVPLIDVRTYDEWQKTGVIENSKLLTFFNKNGDSNLKEWMHELRKIVSKGMGAYYSSGSRPNQTAESWGIARLASAITGGKSAVVDYHLLEKGCNKKSKSLKLAKKAKKITRRKVPKID